MPVDRIAIVLEAMIRRHNLTIRCYGVKEAMKFSYFQDLYAVVKFLNCIDCSCTLHKDEKNQCVQSFTLKGKEHSVEN